MASKEETRRLSEKTDGSKTLLLPKNKSTSYVYILTFFAVLGGFLFGYDTGIISGSMLLITKTFQMSTLWKEMIVSGTVASAFVSALVAGFLSDCLGRKIVILLGSLLFAVGAVLMGVSESVEILLTGRIVVGCGVGFASMTVPVYVAESAPPDIRGRLVTLNQLFITIGILVSSLVAGGFSTLEKIGWRYMLGLGGVPALLQFVGMLYLPESPRWLMDQELEATARASLAQIRGTDDVDKELQEIKNSVIEGRKMLDGNVSVLQQIFRTAHVRRAVIIGTMLQFFQQTCGVNTIIYYSGMILKMGGFPVQQAVWFVAIPNSINFLATFIGLGVVDKFGRKILLIVSFVGVFISLSIIAGGFLLAANTSPPLMLYENEIITSNGCNTTSYKTCYDCTKNLDCGYCYSNTSDGSCLPVNKNNEDQSIDGRCNNSLSETADTYFTYDFCPNDYGWLVVIGMVMFVTSFAPGLGPMPWTINAEIYPLWARSTGFAIATSCNWLFNLLVSLTFLSLMQLITKYGAFWLYGGMSIVGLVFTILFVPETKNKSLEELEALFLTDAEKKSKEQNKKRTGQESKSETGL